MDFGLCLFVQKPLVVWVKKRVCVSTSIKGPACECLLGVCFCVVNDIDPSAGSPTETLLRLLLPRNVQI